MSLDDLAIKQDKYNISAGYTEPDIEIKLFGNNLIVLKVNHEQYPTTVWKRFWMRVFFGTTFKKI
jgi:hypothetical protein